MILSDKAKVKNIEFKTEFYFLDQQVNKYFIKTDQKRLQQVLLNLLSNAIKYTENEKEITIKVEY